MVAWELRNEGLIRYETDRATATFPALINKSNFNRRSNSRPLSGPRCAMEGKSDQRLPPPSSWRNYFASAGPSFALFPLFFSFPSSGKCDYHDASMVYLWFMCDVSALRKIEINRGNWCTSKSSLL